MPGGIVWADRSPGTWTNWAASFRHSQQSQPKIPTLGFRRNVHRDELVTVTEANRMVGFPYPKYLNAIIQVDQAAALIMMSTEKADALGVPVDARVYLNGCSDTVERWNVLDRVNYHSSPAIRVGAREVLDMAGTTVSGLDFMDLYSCFPIAVEMACQEFGIAGDDPRGLTLTGGLPYFGGPGNNYVMHSIAEAIGRARKSPGQRGLVTANGWFLTKYAMGIYSTDAPKDAWQRRALSEYQSQIDTCTVRICGPSRRSGQHRNLHGCA